MSAEASEEPLLRSGTPVGDYTVVRPLGQGGMGTVYLATHPVLGNQLAIKVLRSELALSAEAVRRFEREARLVAQLRHPGIVQVFGFGVLPDGRRYYVMEHLEGETLSARLRSRGALALEETLIVVGELAAALDAAHARGIVHRDLKPSNVFLVADERGGVKLFDFGVAKDLSAPVGEATDGQPVGSLLYMAPEQCRGEPVDRRADVHALGLLALECLVGRSPYAGQSIGAVMVSKQVAPVEIELPEQPTLVPPLLRATSLDPAGRQSTAGELASELAAAAGRALEPLLARPRRWRDEADTTLSPTPTRERRSLARTLSLPGTRPSTRVLLAAAAVLLLAAIAVFATLLLGGPASDPPRPRPTPAPEPGASRAGLSGPGRVPAHAAREAGPDGSDADPGRGADASAGRSAPALTKQQPKAPAPAKRSKRRPRPTGEGSLIRF